VRRHLLVDLTVTDVWFAPGTLAERFWTRSVRLARMTLTQAAEVATVGPAGYAHRRWPAVREQGKTPRRPPAAEFLT
jgi:hypothetical protein